ncbi:MAG: hypothetical protein LBQ21_00555 [Clostridiales Family XIII bacterium]|jgi:hypothetical protein|nr:hypothetical protein [Clostridiales Family XIII bacterium]
MSVTRSDLTAGRGPVPHDPVQQQQEEEAQRYLRGQLLSTEAREADADALEVARRKEVLLVDKANAELLRRGLNADTHTAGYVKISPPDTQPQISSPYGKLTARQKRKLRSRQEDNERKARQSGDPKDPLTAVTVSGETLPMQREIKRLNHKDKTAKPIEVGDDYVSRGMQPQYDAALFDRSFSAKTDIAIDIAAIRSQIKTTEAILQKRTQVGARLTMEEDATFEHLAKTNAAAKTALRAIIGSNGIDSETGDRLSPRDANRFGAEKNKAIAEYRRLTLNRSNLIADILLEKLQQDPRFTGAVAEEAEKRAWAAIAETEGLDEETRARLVARAQNGSTQRDRDGATHDLAKREENQKYYKLMQESDIKFCDLASAGAYMKLLKFVDQNRTRYEQYKKQFDLMFREYSDLMKFLEAQNRLGFRLQQVGSHFGIQAGMVTQMNWNVKDENPRYKVAQVRIRDLGQAMEHLLTGEKTKNTRAAMLLEDEHNIVTDQRREEIEHAKWNTPPTDPEQYAEFAVAHLSRRHRMTANAKKAGIDATAGHSASDRMNRDLGVLLWNTGFETDSSGEPLTEQDRTNKGLCERNARYLRDKSVSVNFADTVLSPIFTEIANFVPTPEMFEDSYFYSHIEQLIGFTEKGLSFADYCTEYPGYVSYLQTNRKALYEKYTRLRSLHTCAASLCRSKLGMIGVDIQHGTMFSEEASESQSNASRGLFALQMDMLKEAFAAYNAAG